MAEWKEIFRRNDVIWGPVPSTQQAAHDPQMEANGVFAEIEPGLRTVTNPLYQFQAWRKSSPEWRPRSAKHTVEVLRSVRLHRGSHPRFTCNAERRWMVQRQSAQVSVPGGLTDYYLPPDTITFDGPTSVACGTSVFRCSRLSPAFACARKVSTY